MLVLLTGLFACVEFLLTQRRISKQSALVPTCGTAAEAVNNGLRRRPTSPDPDLDRLHRPPPHHHLLSTKNNFSFSVTPSAPDKPGTLN